MISQEFVFRKNCGHRKSVQNTTIHNNWYHNAKNFCVAENMEKIDLKRLHKLKFSWYTFINSFPAKHGYSMCLWCVCIHICVCRCVCDVKVCMSENQCVYCAYFVYACFFVWSCILAYGNFMGNSLFDTWLFFDALVSNLWAKIRSLSLLPVVCKVLASKIP